MQPPNGLSDSSINFFGCIVGISFGLASLTGAFEVFKQIMPNTQYKKIFFSVLLISMMNVVGALLPLAIDDSELCLILSSCWLFFASAAIYVLLIYQIFTKQVILHYPGIAIPLFVCTLVLIFLVPYNSHVWRSMIVYKIFLLWGTFILSYRFFLFMRVISILKIQEANSITPLAPDRA